MILPQAVDLISFLKPGSSENHLIKRRSYVFCPPALFTTYLERRMRGSCLIEYNPNDGIITVLNDRSEELGIRINIGIV